MAKFNINEQGNYVEGGGNGGSFFSLKANHETAKVRFLYDSIEDVSKYEVHEIKNDGQKFSKTNVNCLRGYGAPIDDCPFCKSGKFPLKTKYFIPLYNIDTGKNQIWERGTKYGAKLSSLCARYPHLVSHIFEIERNGEAGDQQTTYELYEIDRDESRLSDFDEPLDPSGISVLDKSAEEMQYFLDRGVWMDGGNGGSNGGTARRNYTQDYDDNRVVRRTPANSGRRESESF